MNDNTNVKLSLCIPTYNRAAYLAQTLESIVTQATDQVEIVVSDNASTDDTKAVVRQYQQRCPRLTYFRQEQNVGADRNYLSVVAHATGEYCWLLGDDDLIEEQAISRLLDTYLIRPVDYVQLSVTVYDAGMKKVLGRSMDALGLFEDIYTTDVPWFFARLFQESYLSVFVVKRTLWNAINPANYIGTGLVYLAIVYEYLRIDSPVQFVAAPLVKYRAGNASWSSAALEVIIGHMNYVLNSLPAHYVTAIPEARRRYEARVPVTLAMLASLRADGYYDLARYHKYVRDYFASRLLHRAASCLIAITPPAFFEHLRSRRKKAG